MPHLPPRQTRLLTAGGLNLLRALTAWGLLILSMVLRTLALRFDLDWPPPARRALARWLAITAGCWWLLQRPDDAPRVLYAQATLLAGTLALALALAWHATRAGRATPSRSGRVLAWVETRLAAAFAVRGVAIEMGWSDPRALAPTWDLALLTAASLAAARYSNRPYLGMALDHQRARETRLRDAQLGEAARRQAAKSTATEPRELLQQRDRLAADRDQLLRVLAHEIRQPLHNARGALQAARSARPGLAAQPHPSADRLLRAEAVLGTVHSVLDNTLAAATLPRRDAPIARPDTDVDFLVTLTLGDLPEALRARVRVDWQGGPRSAELEPGLARLALRNRLRNAFGHGDPAVSVQPRIEEQACPSTRVLSVIDDGVGLPTARLQDAPAASQAMPRLGLGLFIARQVMALHGGALELARQQPHGTVARPVFPQASLAGPEAVPSPAPPQARSSGARKT